MFRSCVLMAAALGVFCRDRRRRHAAPQVRPVGDVGADAGCGGSDDDAAVRR